VGLAAGELGRYILSVRVRLHHSDRVISVASYWCDADARERPFPEVHEHYSLSYVRRGTFGYSYRGARHELVPGSLLVGRPGEEFTCTHGHHGGGDECLSFRLDVESAATLGDAAWDAGALPPLAELGVIGELAQSAVEGRSDSNLIELGLMLTARFAEVATGRPSRPLRASPQDRRRAIEAALWMEENASAEIGLEVVARRSGLSSFHFLRLFSGVVGTTPHQFLLRARLRRAARLLSEPELPVSAVALEAGFKDLSNFVRTFQRAAGLSPRAFRRLSRVDRKILQDRLATCA
jgi:AraC-like DNA-binding protein